MPRNSEVLSQAPEATAQMRVSEIPEELRPYAFGLHAQIYGLLREMDVASVKELDERMHDDARAFLPHIERIRQVDELLSKLQEVLAAPREYLAEQKREGASKWLEGVRVIVEEMPSSGDAITDRWGMEKMAMRLRQADEGVLGIPLTDVELTAWMAKADPDDSLRDVAREAARIAIEKKRYNLVLEAFPPETRFFGDPTPAVVQAMIADGLLDEAEAVVERMQSGANGYEREVGYVALAKARRAKGEPWRELYDKGVASYVVADSTSAARQAEIEAAKLSTVNNRVIALGTLGCGREAAELFTSVEHKELNSDIDRVVYFILESGECDALKDFAAGLGFNSDQQREILVRIARSAVDRHAPDADARVHEAEEAFADEDDLVMPAALANLLAVAYEKRGEWDKLDALVPLFIPDAAEAEVFRHFSQFLRTHSDADARAILRAVEANPDLHEDGDTCFSEIVTYYLSQGDQAAAAEWRAHIKDKAHDPWFAFFTFTLRSGDVRGARDMVDDLVKQNGDHSSLYPAMHALLEVYAKAGDADAFVAFLKSVPVPEGDERPAARRRERGMNVLYSVLTQACNAVKPVV